jgi:hypothetical protein
MKIKRNCLICNKEILSIPSRVKTGRGKFCSPKCFGKWLSKNIRGINHPNWKGGKGQIKKICSICKKDYFVYPSEIKNGHSKFCSNECKNKGNSKRIRGKERSELRKGKFIKCLICEKEIYATPVQIKKDLEYVKLSETGHSIPAIKELAELLLADKLCEPMSESEIEEIIENSFNNTGKHYVTEIYQRHFIGELAKALVGKVAKQNVLSEDVGKYWCPLENKYLRNKCKVAHSHDNISCKFNSGSVDLSSCNKLVGKIGKEVAR